MPWWQLVLAATGASGILIPLFLAWAWWHSTRPTDGDR